MKTCGGLFEPARCLFSKFPPKAYNYTPPLAHFEEYSPMLPDAVQVLHHPLGDHCVVGLATGHRVNLGAWSPERGEHSPDGILW